jgi:hypothetical protein
MKKLFLLLFVLPLAVLAQQADPGYGYFRTSALTNAGQAVKAGGTNLFGYTLINVNTAPVYVKFYNGSATNVVVGTTVPRLVIMVPPGDGTSPGIVYLAAENLPAAFFPTGLVVACVTGLADASAVAPSTPIYSETIYK